MAETGQEAARTADYKGNNQTLKAVASENLTKPYLRQYLQSLAEDADRHSTERIMTREEALTRTSFLAAASLDLVLDAKGHFDIHRARATGDIHALKKVRVRNFTRRHKDGTVDEVVTTEVELRDKNGSLELMGKHHNLWTGEIGDYDEILARLSGYPKGLLPTKLDEPDAIDAEVVEVPNNGEERSLTPTPEESIASNPPAPSEVEVMRQDEKAPVEYALQGYRRLNLGNGKLPVE